MYHMKRATVRDLRYNFRKIEELLRDGTEIQITKRKRVVARLMPPAEEKTFKKPDFEARIRKIFGKKKLKVTGAEIVGWGRQE
jgi:antitoxin (DNA-binding transcriptional repressor) of toxin-antitoxin stability system